jgi:predicted nucleic acid-binding protein
VRLTIDSNILIYAADAGAGAKQHQAIATLERAAHGDCVLTLQALGEFYNVASRGRVSSGAPEAVISRWRKIFPIHAAAEATLDQALSAVREHRLQFWDAILWATAREAGCRLLLSEDFQDGRELDGVRFVNPFNPANAALIDSALPPLADSED